MLRCVLCWEQIVHKTCDKGEVLRWNAAKIPLFSITGSLGDLWRQLGFQEEEKSFLLGVVYPYILRKDFPWGVVLRSNWWFEFAHKHLFFANLTDALITLFKSKFLTDNCFVMRSESPCCQLSLFSHLVYSAHSNIHQRCSKWSVSDKSFLSSQWKQFNFVCCAFQMSKQNWYFYKDYFRDHSEKGAVVPSYHHAVCFDSFNSPFGYVSNQA